MSYLRQLLGGKEETPDEYPHAEMEDDPSTEKQAEYIIQTVEIEGTQDILTVKDHLHSGNIVFMELIQDSKISTEHILDDIQQTVDQLGGDIAFRTDDEVIVTPARFYISRERE